MNPIDYSVVVVHMASDEKHNLVYWRGVHLYSHSAVRFLQWLRWEFNLFINHTYLNSSADWQRTHCDAYDNSPWERRWHLSIICLLQGHARKIQKWWISVNTAGIMPCSEEVFHLKENNIHSGISAVYSTKDTGHNSSSDDENE